MGIDPGTQIAGVGIIDVKQNNEVLPCMYDAIRTRRNNSLAQRLKDIYEGLNNLLEKSKNIF